jgi:hypothetical protein
VSAARLWRTQGNTSANVALSRTRAVSTSYAKSLQVVRRHPNGSKPLKQRRSRFLSSLAIRTCPKAGRCTVDTAAE